MKTYTICGSMRFAKQMKEIAYYLETQKSFNVLQCVYIAKDVKFSENDLLALQNAHYKKIDISDGIYVVNIDGYIGESVKKEIEYAKQHNKEVLYHEKI